MSKIHFSLVFYAEKLEKIKIQFLVTKRAGSKSNINIIFEIFGGYLYNNSGNIFRIKLILKDLMNKIHFSLAFYAENLEKIKIKFLVTKRGQNRI